MHMGPTDHHPYIYLQSKLLLVRKRYLLQYVNQSCVMTVNVHRQTRLLALDWNTNLADQNLEQIRSSVYITEEMLLY